MTFSSRVSRRTVVWLAVLVVVQLLCAAFFIFDILSALTGIVTEPLNWRLREFMEIGAALGLVLGIFAGGYALHRALGDRNDAREQLERASGVFMGLLEQRFDEWRLTPAEKDVALFALKGLSTADIARLRQTSEGTVKAQTYAIYKKAGVTGKSQLLSLFFEDLMADDSPIRAVLSENGKAAPAAPQAAESRQ